MRSLVPALFSILTPTLATAAPQCLLLAEGAPDPTGDPFRLEGDRYGSALALAGDTLLVGAPRAGAHMLRRGAVHVLERGARGWAETELWSGGEEFDQFGNALALDEAAERALVAAFFERQSGVVHAFARGAAGWAEEQELVPSAAQLLEGFGYSLALEGDSLLVGAPFRHGIGWAFHRGAAFAFESVGGAWVEVQQIDSEDARPGAWFGAALAQSGLWSAIGAPRHDERGAEAGAVEVRERTPAGWVFATRLLPAGFAQGAHFGAALALRGEWLAVGAPERSVGPARPGAVHLYRRGAGAWSPAGTLLVPGAGDGARVGARLAFDGAARLLVGAPGAGRVDVYEEAGGAWTHTQVVADDVDAREWGGALAADRERWVIGVPGDDAACPLDANCDGGAIRLLAAPLRPRVVCAGNVAGGGGLELEGCAPLESLGLVARVTGLPAFAPIVILVGPPALGITGQLCVGGPATRWATGYTDGAGDAVLALPFAAGPPALALLGGTWRVQGWFQGSLLGAQLTVGLEVTLGG